ncbi:excalibur calcium-binding domain-containing protein [Saccharopolyspora sp. ID03-671]|uniref:excalibur calcium-binding domain-containing protein n=1 Tax=Saccharopolyspora sp. ID03-671 TaxID=3073066 RepID=UPI0032516382
MAFGVLGIVIATAGCSSTPQPEVLSQPELPTFNGKSLGEAERAATSAGYMVTSHDASDGDATPFDFDNWTVCFQSAGNRSVNFGVVRVDAPCLVRDGDPIPWPKIPDLVQWKFVDAKAKLIELGATDVRPQATYVDQQPPADPDDWLVCFQEPSAGADAKLPLYASLSLVDPGTSCPQQEGTYLNPPDPDPDPDPDVRHVPTPDSSSSGSGSTNGNDSGGGSVYYPNCSAARAAGADPIYAGEPGYRGAPDRNKDGVACE